MIETVPVQSSNLAEVGYDPELSILEVRFLKSGVYQYFGVPQYLYEQLLAAPSKGTFFNEYIRKAGYPYQRIG
jgi:hypothetical protein